MIRSAHSAAAPSSGIHPPGHRQGFLLQLALALCLAVTRGSVAEAADQLARTEACATALSALQHAGGAAALAPLDAAGRRKFAPDRLVDILHLKIDLTPDFKARSIKAAATLTLKPIEKPLSELSLDAVSLAVDKVTGTPALSSWESTDTHLIVSFEKPVAPGKEVSLVVEYSAHPTQGLYFRTPENGTDPGDLHLFTQGEINEASHWFPIHDAPNEKFTSEIICHVPEGMTVISNGREVSATKNATNALVAHHWKQEKVHSSYLISLVAGYFGKLEDHHRDLPMAFHAPPSQIADAAEVFKDTRDAMEFFEKEIGVPYPWAKYDQVAVQGFMFGGMENTSATTLTDGALHPKEVENLHDEHGLVAHELAHQWFGDLVTCKDWAHAWLNEGFATYYAHLYEGHKNGHDAFLYSLRQSASFLSQDAASDKRPTVDREYDRPLDLFGYTIYSKGGWILHMLRHELGEDLYRRCIRTYLERHALGNVVTEDLNRVIEELSGRSFDSFFDQWVFHPHHPELELQYSWDQKTRMARVTVHQTQPLSEKLGLFDFPLTIRFRLGNVNLDRTVRVRQKDEDFHFALASAPDLVRIDPDYALLARIRFETPGAMLETQLADSKDVIGRLLAVEQLGRRKDAATVKRLKKVLNEDGFHGVRTAAAQALRSMGTPEALAALIPSRTQSDARVRQSVIQAIANFYRPEALDALLKASETERNPVILAGIVRALGRFPSNDLKPRLEAWLNANSWHGEVPSAAITALGAQADPSAISPILTTLRAREKTVPGWNTDSACLTLAQLARDQDATVKRPVRDFLLERLHHPRFERRSAAIRALGTLGDEGALGPLETFATQSRNNPEAKDAEDAIRSIRDRRPASVELGNLRREVLDLQKSGRELEKQLGDLRKQLEAVQSNPAGDRKSGRNRSNGSKP